MTALPEFLLARIAEDEAVARESEQATRDEARRAGRPDPDLGALQSDLELDSEHGFVGVDASRVLAECEAKRRIVTTQQSLASFDRYPDVDYTGIDAELSRLDWVCHLLALPYADHPDYREEWRA